MKYGIFIALASLLFGSAAYAGVKKGQPAPDFALTNLQGSKVSLSSLRGKVVLVDFWAHWCEPCKKELPQLDRLAKAYAGKPVVVLTVNIDKERGNVDQMVKQLGLSLPVLLDPNGSVASSYDLPKMPTSFVIDRGGTVRYVNQGFEGAADIERMKKELDELSK